MGSVGYKNFKRDYYCMCCGRELNELHPHRLVYQKYEKAKSMYKHILNYDLCTVCYNKFESFFGKCRKDIIDDEE